MLKPLRDGSKIQMRDISIFAQNSHFTHLARSLLPHPRTPVGRNDSVGEVTSYNKARKIGYAKRLASKLGLTIRKQRPPRYFQPVVLALFPLLADSKDKPVLVQIFARDGQLNDPISRHALSGEFQCYLVEPVPTNCDMLRKRLEVGLFQSLPPTHSLRGRHF